MPRPELLGVAPSNNLIITVKVGNKTCSVALRPDTAEYLLEVEIVDPKDWRTKDLVQAVWAAAQQLK